MITIQKYFYHWALKNMTLQTIGSSTAKHLWRNFLYCNVAYLTLISTAVANTQDLEATTVPASSCQPASSSRASMVQLSNGAWVFSGSKTGTVEFYCPLPLNNLQKSSNEQPNSMTHYRIYYRDTDGINSNSSVKVQLTYRTYTGQNLAGGTWDSNSVAEEGNTAQFYNLNHKMRANSIYAFFVSMFRSNPNQSPAFSGIDFITPIR